MISEDSGAFTWRGCDTSKGDGTSHLLRGLLWRISHPKQPFAHPSQLDNPNSHQGQSSHGATRLLGENKLYLFKREPIMERRKIPTPGNLMPDVRCLVTL